MKARLFTVIATAFFLSAVAGAQSYHIRVTHNSNLRATYSLEGAIIETAPAGATLHVVGKVNRWLKINRNGNEVWMADWIDYSRVENSDQPSSQMSAATAIDNCCFVDRQCQSDQDWTAGYWAFQNGQCAAPAQSQSGTSTQPASKVAGPIDNCCFAGWQCNTDLEWANGYYAYRDNQCGAAPSATSNVDSCCQLGWNCTFEFDFIMGRWWFEDIECNMPIQELVDGVIIEGSEAFIAENKGAMNLIKSRAPEWYAYTIDIIQKIRESKSEPGPGHGTLHKSFNLPVWGSVDYAATIIIHETCHVHRSYAGVHTTEIENIAEEAICDQVAIYALNQISPGTPYPLRRTNNFLSLGLDYDLGASVQREWDRARRIFSQSS